MASKIGYLLGVSWPTVDDDIAVDKAVASSDFAVDNLLNKQPSITWKSGDATVQTLSGDFTKPRPVDAFCLWNHNLTANATIQFRLLGASGSVLFDKTYGAVLPTYGWGEQPWDVGQWGGFTDEGFVPTYTVRTLDEIHVPSSWELIISDTGNSDGYIEAGSLLIGDTWQPDANFEWAAFVGWVDPSEFEVYEDQSIGVVDELEPYRVGELRWNWLDTLGARGFNEITRRIGKKNLVLVNPYPEEETTLAREQRVLVRLQQWQQPARQRNRHYAAAVSFREAL